MRNRKFYKCLSKLTNLRFTNKLKTQNRTKICGHDLFKTFFIDNCYHHLVYRSLLRVKKGRRFLYIFQRPLEEHLGSKAEQEIILLSSYSIETIFNKPIWEEGLISNPPIPCSPGRLIFTCNGSGSPGAQLNGDLYVNLCIGHYSPHGEKKKRS